MKDVPVPLHFGFDGTPDLFGNKWLLIIFPLMAVFLTVCIYIYRKKIGNNPNIKAENGFFYAFTALTIGLGYAVYLESIGGGKLSGQIVSYYIVFGLGLLMIYTGILMKNIKQNKFFGVRTKYTLKNEQVWNKTHKLSSKMGIIGGSLIIFCGVLSLLIFNTLLISIIGLIMAIILFAFIPIIYARKISDNNVD